MNLKPLPGTALRASPICLGTGSIGSTIPREESFALMDAYLDMGGNFLDTAKIYADWLPGERSCSEKTIGRWMRERKNRDRVLLATKGAHLDMETKVSRLAPADIEADLHASLGHLQTDVIDLYWLHRDDVNRPVEEVLETLARQVKAGKIRYFGCSNWTLGRIEAAQEYAAKAGLPGFVANQMKWSLAVPDPQAPGDPTMVAMDAATWRYHRDTQLAAVPFSSQAGGWFQKKADYAAGRRSEPPGGAFNTEANERRFQGVMAVAKDTGLTVTQVVLGYLLSQPFPAFPIVGSHTVEQLRDCMSAADVRLAARHLALLK